MGNNRTINRSECFLFGSIVKAAGFKGEIIIALSGKFPKIKNTEWLFVEINKEFVPFFVEKISITEETAAVKLEDIDSVHQAEKLIGLNIFLYKDLLTPVQKEKFANKDMIGFNIIDKNHGKLGIVNDIFTFPKQDIIQVYFKEREVLIPITESIITKIDRKNKTLQIELPEGLLEIYK